MSNNSASSSLVRLLVVTAFSLVGSAGYGQVTKQSIADRLKAVESTMDEYKKRDNESTRYIALLERVNGQITDNATGYQTQYTWQAGQITVLGAIIGLCAIAGTVLLFRQSQDFKKQQKEALDTAKASIAAFLQTQKTAIDEVLAKGAESLASLKGQVEGELKPLVAGYQAEIDEKRAERDAIIKDHRNAIQGQEERLKKIETDIALLEAKKKTVQSATSAVGKVAAASAESSALMKALSTDNFNTLIGKSLSVNIVPSDSSVKLADLLKMDFTPIGGHITVAPDGRISIKPEYTCQKCKNRFEDKGLINTSCPKCGSTDLRHS